MAFREDVNFGRIRSEKGYFDAANKKVIGAQGGAIADLTGAFGTANGSIVDVTGAFSQSILNDNFRELEDKTNAILGALRAHGLIA